MLRFQIRPLESRVVLDADIPNAFSELGGVGTFGDDPATAFNPISDFADTLIIDAENAVLSYNYSEHYFKSLYFLDHLGDNEQTSSESCVIGDCTIISGALPGTLVASLLLPAAVPESSRKTSFIHPDGTLSPVSHDNFFRIHGHDIVLNQTPQESLVRDYVIEITPHHQITVPLSFVELDPIGKEGVENPFDIASSLLHGVARENSR